MALLKLREYFDDIQIPPVICWCAQDYEIRCKNVKVENGEDKRFTSFTLKL